MTVEARVAPMTNKRPSRVVYRFKSKSNFDHFSRYDWRQQVFGYSFEVIITLDNTTTTTKRLNDFNVCTNAFFESIITGWTKRIIIEKKT
jgi:hypothetical protein